MNKNILQFKIMLNYVEPKVWRRICVPENYRFWDLHCAIQNAMGWIGCHLHGFSMSSKIDGRLQPLRIQMPNVEWDTQNDLDESKEQISTWFPSRLKQCIYTYDFGDTWDHTIIFERMFPARQGEKYPICVAGKNTCPPEDCGGPGGYADLYSVINDPQSSEGQRLRAWLGLEKSEQFDSGAWNPEDVRFENPKILLREYLRSQDSG